MCCTVLYCMLLYGTVLHCTVLYLTKLSALHCLWPQVVLAAQECNVLQCSARSKLNCTAFLLC